MLEIRGRLIDKRVERSEQSVAQVRVLADERRPRIGRRPLRILAAFPDGPWEERNLIPALSAFGDVETFDLSGLEAPKGAQSGQVREAKNRELCRVIQAGTKEGPFDLLFAYASEWHLAPSTLEWAHSQNCRTFCFSLDDRVAFASRRGGRAAGIAGLAPSLDLTGTNCMRSIRKIVAAGGRGVFFPEGADPVLFTPRAQREEFDIGFIGVAYGWRPWLIWKLRRAGFTVATAGPGWPDGPVALEDVPSWVASARVILGVGGIGHSLNTTCLKGRDFELPMAGAIYLPQADEDLTHFCADLTAGTWRSVEELVERARSLVALPPEERATIRRRVACEARRRHTWRHRIAMVLAALGLPDPTADVEREDEHHWPAARVFSAVEGGEAPVWA